MRQGFFRHVAHDHLRAGVTRFQVIDDMAGELMRMGLPAAGLLKTSKMFLMAVSWSR